MDEGLYYKLAHENGWDFLTGETINFREAIGSVVRVPKVYESGRKPDSLEFRAYNQPSECFRSAWIPCSAYLVAGTPVRYENGEFYFEELEVVEELTDLDTFFGWNYSEAANPINPFTDVAKQDCSDDVLFLAGQWASIYMSICNTAHQHPLDPIWSYIWQMVGKPVCELITADFPHKWGGKYNYEWVSAADSSIKTLFHVYALSIFKDAGRMFFDNDLILDDYIFRVARGLWCGGVVPAFSDKWRLYSGPEAEVIWEEENASNV